MSYFELNLCPQLQALIYNYFISAIGLKILLSNTKKPFKKSRKEKATSLIKQQLSLTKKVTFPTDPQLL
jgi:hypothetical protein